MEDLETEEIEELEKKSEELEKTEEELKESDEPNLKDELKNVTEIYMLKKI